MSYSDYDSDSEYEVCPRRSNSCALPFNPTCLENIILTIIDQFDFRVIMSNERTKGALLVTGGFTMVGGLIGRHYGGRVGAIVGGAVGGACGLGVVVISIREIWQDIKAKLSEVFDIVYDYLAGLGLDDYKKAAMFLSNSGDSAQLAMIIMETASNVLGKKIMSSLTAA